MEENKEKKSITISDIVFIVSIIIGGVLGFIYKSLDVFGFAVTAIYLVPATIAYVFLPPKNKFIMWWRKQIKY